MQGHAGTLGRTLINVCSISIAFLRYCIHYDSARKHPHLASESAWHSLVSGGSLIIGVEAFVNPSFTARSLPEFSPQPVSSFQPWLRYGTKG